MQHSAKLRPGKFDSLIVFSKKLQGAIHAQMVEKGTRDLDRSGLTTEQFVDAVVEKLEKERKALLQIEQPVTTQVDPRHYDQAAMKKLFDSIDADKNGNISFDEFAAGMKHFFVSSKQ